MKINGRLLVVCTILLALLVSTKADIKRECRKQSMVSWESLKKLKDGDFEQDDPRIKCYLRCFMMKNGILDDNDQWTDLEKALQHLPRFIQESSWEIFRRCKSVPGDDLCDKAFQVARCYVKLQPLILNFVSFV
ncbi:general odorant-binding protein 56d-like [Vespa mandarinia]|uniref:general odorant-binding protein 56d-like n=1 Tax=Vespa mandarinia TaxID=7446 RepID=UPI001619B98C|nr:general odorant-binding protein 56d-like [Vespa mandarinia]XP_046829355.1 general odorant-binding protein 56d-like [Vespa crabro]XP_047367005.1 general odorant-binding protein 56d-like [Vespa velutina]